MLRDSMDGFGTPKRPLTEVKEEPHEREEEHAMMYNLSDGQDDNCKFGARDVSVRPIQGHVLG